MRLEFGRSWVRFPAGLRCVFSSDPAVSSSIFVGAEFENLNFCYAAKSGRIFPYIDDIGRSFSSRGFYLSAGYAQIESGENAASNQVRLLYTAFK